MRNVPLALLLLLAPASSSSAQVVFEDFEAANTDDWGQEFGAAAPHLTTGGRPDGRIEVAAQSASSSLRAAMIVPGAAQHRWSGDFRSLRVAALRFDRQVERGTSKFGTILHVVLANDAGTPNDFDDDAWVFTSTGDTFQHGAVPWATVRAPIPSHELLLPSTWEAAALPSSPLLGVGDDLIWDAVIRDVSYVGIAMHRPYHTGVWLGGHHISLDNLVLETATGNLGRRYCSPAAPNSTGLPGLIDAWGQASVQSNDLTLTALDLPPNAIGIFLASRDRGLTPGPGGSQGTLCLGGAVGRFVGPGQVQSATASGTIALPLDLAQLPSANGLVAAAPGDTWHFQAWYRDVAGGSVVSNFTDGVSVVFD